MPYGYSYAHWPDDRRRLHWVVPILTRGRAHAQVHQARLLLEMEVPGADLAARAPEGLLAAAQSIWTESAKQVTISDFHRDVSATLHAMSIECASPTPPFGSWPLSAPLLSIKNWCCR